MEIRGNYLVWPVEPTGVRAPVGVVIDEVTRRRVEILMPKDKLVGFRPRGKGFAVGDWAPVGGRLSLPERGALLCNVLNLACEQYGVNLHILPRPVRWNEEARTLLLLDACPEIPKLDFKMELRIVGTRHNVKKRVAA